MADEQIQIRLYADYVAWPLWGPHGPLQEDELPLSADLKNRIRAWFNAYDRPRDDWPLWTPPLGVAADQVERAWAAEGHSIGEALQIELGPHYLIRVEL